MGSWSVHLHFRLCAMIVDLYDYDVYIDVQGHAIINNLRGWYNNHQIA
jgi:hypothetical protein